MQMVKEMPALALHRGMCLCRNTWVWKLNNQVNTQMSLN